MRLEFVQCDSVDVEASSCLMRLSFNAFSSVAAGKEKRDAGSSGGGGETCGRAGWNERGGGVGSCDADSLVF